MGGTGEAYWRNVRVIKVSIVSFHLARYLVLIMDSTYSGIADSVIRCEPGEDRTNGFFVALFIAGLAGLPNGPPASSLNASPASAALTVTAAAKKRKRPNKKGGEVAQIESGTIEAEPVLPVIVAVEAVVAPTVDAKKKRKRPGKANKPAVTDA